MTVSSLISDCSRDLTFAWSYWRSIRYRRLLCSTHWYRKRCSRLWSPLRSCTSSPPVPPRPCSMWWSHPTLKYQHGMLPVWIPPCSDLCDVLEVAVTTSSPSSVLWQSALLGWSELTNWENYWLSRLSSHVWRVTVRTCLLPSAASQLTSLHAYISVLCQVMTK